MRADNYSNKNSLIVDSLFGVINAIIILPVTISFTSIIFREPIFLEYLPILIKLVLFSSIIHQLIFSAISSLPFRSLGSHVYSSTPSGLIMFCCCRSVGQVQDAGLIFLSAMASSIVKYEAKKGQSDHAIPTTLVALSLATLFLGINLAVSLWISDE
jgi:sulfate permease, SulP family